MDTHGPEEIEVLIVGAGPTGLTLANILGMHGIRTLIVERNAATVGEPRAVSIDDESLRTMQYIGLIDTVRGTIVQGYGSHYFSPGGKCFAKVIPETVEYGYSRRSAFRQPILEAQLREGLKRHPTVEARFGSKVTRIEETGAALRAEISGPDGSVARRLAQYVVACDGGRSGIREALGIKMGGSTYDERWLIVDLTGSTDPFRHEFMMLPGEASETLLEEAHVRSLLGRYSEEDAQLPIARKAIYHFHARLAECWRVGRVFLAGDAAHLTPPFAGQGMNSGIRDAQNLGWKLSFCLRGGLGSGALDSYELERKPHAWALIQMAVRMGRVMMPRARRDAVITQAAFRALSLFRPARDYVMQMKYKPRPFFAQGIVAGDAGKEIRGRMFPQPFVECRDGSHVLLDTVLGQGFAVLELDDAKLPLSAPRKDRLLGAATVRIIPKEHRFLPQDAGGALHVRDVSGAIGKLLDHAGLRGVVLRPDRYVAACLARHSTADEADRCLDALVALSNSASPSSTAPQALDLAIA
jgi:3-(3-hydroxy-phenyl)propionate hydroxylase